MFNLKTQKHHKGSPSITTLFEHIG